MLLCEWHSLTLTLLSVVHQSDKQFSLADFKYIWMPLKVRAPYTDTGLVMFSNFLGMFQADLVSFVADLLPA